MFATKILETIRPGVAALIARGLHLRLICGDDEVTWDVQVGTVGTLVIKGSGGTRYDPLLERAMQYRPSEILFITDLLPSVWPEKPSVPVHFIVPKQSTLVPPWGTILCRVEE